MKSTKKITSLKDFENNVKELNSEMYVLRLYVTGMTPNSQNAVENIKKICEAYLKGRYELEIIDVYQQPQLAEGEQIVASPTLIKKLPYPLKRLVGNMSDVEKVLVGLDIKTKT